MITRTAHIQRIVMVRLNPGDEVLYSLQQAVQQENLKNGIILNGFGSTENYKYHVVADRNLPPLEAFPAGDQVRDILGYSGLIIDGRVHAHITLSDAVKAEGGHLEPGTKALTFSIIYIADLGDITLNNWDTVERMDS